MARLTTLLFLLLLCVAPMYAQALRVTGTVTSAEDGEPLIGVSV